MAQIAELRRLAIALAIEPGLRVGHRLVGLIRALLAAEVLLAVAARIGRWGAAVLRLEGSSFDAQASISVPSTEKCSTRQQRLDPGIGQHRQQKAPVVMSPSKSRSRFLVNTVTSHTAASIDKPDEPSEQHIVADLFHQLPFRAHAVKRLQQQRPQQLLRRNRLKLEAVQKGDSTAGFV